MDGSITDLPLQQSVTMSEGTIIDLHQPIIMPSATAAQSADPNSATKSSMYGGEDYVASPESPTTSPTTTDSKSEDPSKEQKEKEKTHRCDVCGNMFKRLEHLKRHERTHSKEKPFECPICRRCFARRDLLLRHQQKLHAESTVAAKPRKRSGSSSAGGVGGPNRVRKNSSANSSRGGSAMRPRANTLSNVDGVRMQMAASQAAIAFQNHVIHPNRGHSRHHSLAGLPMGRNYGYSGMGATGGMSVAMDHRGMNNHGLKIETADLMSYSGGLRTAPVQGSLQNPGFEHDSFRNFDFPNGSTINPSALQYNGSPQSLSTDSIDPFHPGFLDPFDIPMLDDTHPFVWPMQASLNSYAFDPTNENAIDNSSPSAISTPSYSGLSDGVMLDGSINAAKSSGSMWHQPQVEHPMRTPNFVDPGNQHFANLPNGNPMSPHSLPQNHMNSPYFPNPSPLGPSIAPGLHNGLNNGLNNNGFHSPMTPGAEAFNSMPGHFHGSLPSHTLTDSTRATMETHLAHDPSFGGRKYSFTSANSPSPRFPARGNSISESARLLPPTPDLQRFINAYIEFFHPHLPFLHIPTLSFVPQPTVIEGPGCILLSMAAIGALYEQDYAQAKVLFESAKKMLQLYIEDRRKAGIRRADPRKISADSRTPETSSHTPVWLVQAMLLNIIYGINCADKVAGDNAMIHCATLVSLARSAELSKPSPTDNGSSQNDVRMTNGDNAVNGHINSEIPDDQQEWHNWKVAEEKKRTLYAVFILSSMLVSTYNHQPALPNSEIATDLPCDEEFWSAKDANSFYAMGGSQKADENQITFKAALFELLRAGNNPQHQQAQTQGFRNGHNAQESTKGDLKPSTFGCFILINAIHNVIWETRQRHASNNTKGANERTEKMHRHIEPVLRAWQEAWKRNEKHAVIRPNPNGLGPLSADSVPLLDLAYIRLFVDMSKSKEKFWQRDFDGMADELAPRGSEMIQNAEHSPSSNTDSLDFSGGSTTSSAFVDSPTSSNSPPDLKPSRAFQNTLQISSADLKDREDHLRRAANYAVDALTMSNRYGITFADLTSRELPLQSALSAFDSAQVIAEWVTALQERIGRGLNAILGKDHVDMDVVPGILFIEVEDATLLHKIQEVLNSAERKMHLEQTYTIQTNAPRGLPALDDCGYGAKILRVTAYMLDKATVWPVTRIMARALETQAIHMQIRAERSVSQR